MPDIKKIIVRNRLRGELKNVRVVYGQSQKPTNVFAYAVDWRQVDIETGHLIGLKTEVKLPDISVDNEAKESCSICFMNGLRGYWQVYFEMDGTRYKIDKNNAQVNPWSQDDGKYVEITARYEGDYIRIDFVMDSGNAYFYAKSY